MAPAGAGTPSPQPHSASTPGHPAAPLWGCMRLPAALAMHHGGCPMEGIPATRDRAASTSSHHTEVVDSHSHRSVSYRYAGTVRRRLDVVRRHSQAQSSRNLQQANIPLSPVDANRAVVAVVSLFLVLPACSHLSLPAQEHWCQHFKGHLKRQGDLCTGTRADRGTQPVWSRTRSEDPRPPRPPPWRSRWASLAPRLSTFPRGYQRGHRGRSKRPVWLLPSQQTWRGRCHIPPCPKTPCVAARM